MYAGIHRVLPVRSSKGRYSVPFFFQPKVDATIEPWLADGESARYQPFVAAIFATESRTTSPTMGLKTFRLNATE